MLAEAVQLLDKTIAVIFRSRFYRPPCFPLGRARLRGLRIEGEKVAICSNTGTATWVCLLEELAETEELN